MTSRSRAHGKALASFVAASFVAHGVGSVGVLGAVTGRGPAQLGPVRLRGRSTDAVALTFDDGPSPATTPRVLDLLDHLRIRATFFVLGSAARRHAELVADTLARGHQVETHGMEHRHHLLQGPRWIFGDMRRAVETMSELRAPSRYFRPPYGQAATATLVAARAAGLETVLWSAWGREFADRSARSVAQRVNGQLRPGAVVLLHDSNELCGPGSVETVLEALPLVAEELERRGLRAAPMSEVLE